MNTIKSVGYGWGVLIVAGGGSYYFAKRSINADREERAAAEEKRRQQRDRMRVQEMMRQRDAAAGTGPGSSSIRRKEHVIGGDNPDPSQQADTDEAPVTHEQVEMAKRGKYEASTPYRSRKGDRFS
ncbi:hypothetical protein LTR86_003669 [Recurvomyces mirabilis]|nr:hypothetical protein LTR86_003669 [Recurvomyces mirabilis]